MSNLEMHAVTDVGVRRSHNEDNVGITPEMGFAVLADGMGGHNAGEVASAMAVDITTRILSDSLAKIGEGELDESTGFSLESSAARSAVATANNAIFETSQQKRECAGMGTTIVVALFYGNRLTAAHVGDSRMYRFRNDLLTHVTEDHSLIQEQVRRGLLTADDARNSSLKNLVTRALGVEPDVEPDIVEDIVRPGDIYLLCSDGLTDVVPDEAIRLTLEQFNNDLRKAASQLILLANDAGGPDNISVILIRALKPFHRKRGGFFSRLFGG